MREKVSITRVEYMAFAVMVSATLVLAWILTGGDVVWMYRIVLLQVVLQIAIKEI